MEKEQDPKLENAINVLRKKQHAANSLWLALTGVLLALSVALTLSLLRVSSRLESASTLKDKEAKADLKKFEFVYGYVLNRYVEEKSSAELYKAAVNGLFSALGDPYSAYLTDASARNVHDTVQGEFGGVGLTIVKRNPDDKTLSEKERYVEVVGAIEDTPAYRAGIKAGDYITRIGGLETKDMDSNAVLDVLRGKHGTKVTVTVLRDEAVFDVELKRATIEIQTVKSAMIGEIGYLRLIQFTPQLLARAREAIRGFEKAGYKGLIIDVRDNPGGQLNTVVSFSDDLLDSGVIVATRSRIQSEEETFKADKKTLVNANIPIVVLLNRGSASASEILAGALQDNGRATLIGAPSYGKASVQTIQNIKSDGSEAFKLTIAHYLTPSGKDINAKGIEPDILAGEEPEPTPENQESARRMYEGKDLENFAQSYPNPTPAQIDAFAASQKQKGNTLPEAYLKRRAWLASAYKKEPAPVYDAVYDTALQKALSYLQTEIK